MPSMRDVTAFMRALIDRLDQSDSRVSVMTRDEALHLLDELLGGMRAAMTAPSAESHRLFASARKLLHGLPLDVLSESRVEGLLLSAQFAYISGQPFSGLEHASLAVECARRMIDAASLRKALTFHGILLADTGNIATAVECYAEALEIAERLHEVQGEAPVWLNLGTALGYAGQFSEAASCYERVVALADQDPLLATRKPLALANIAALCLYLEDYAKGLRSIKAAIESGGEPKSATERMNRVLAECSYTRLLLEVDNFERAKERCELAKRYAHESKSERAELQAALAEGLCEVHAGLNDVGLSRLSQALDRARVLKSELRYALLGMVKAQEVAGKPDVALVYLRELMMHTKKTQQENALRHHRLHLENLARQQQGASEEAVMERHEQSLRGKLAEQVAQQELMRSRIEMLERLAVTAELRDDSTGEHSYRVGRLSSLLGQEYGCDEQTCFMLDLAARLHDIGKIGIPDGILLKPDRLTEAEREIMKTHTTVGAELLAQSEMPHMQMAEDIARFHHEWWDGSGYPNGIGGAAIPIAARITALADVFDALTHRRPYKEPWPVARALDEIAYLKGHQFDPELTDLFLALVRRLQREVGDLDEHLGEAARQSPFIRAREKIATTLRRSSGRDAGYRTRLDAQR
jgi:putative two-component system response regulator